jgi:hypothetical protein
MFWWLFVVFFLTAATTSAVVIQLGNKSAQSVTDPDRIEDIWKAYHIVRAIECGSSEWYPLMDRLVKPVQSVSMEDGSHVPLILHQSQAGTDIPYEMFMRTQMILDQQPELCYYFWTDDRIRKWMKTYMGEEVMEAFNHIIPGAFRADFFRYCVLYHYGGMWLDMGTELYVNIKRWLQDHPAHGLFVVEEEFADVGYWNGCIIASPGHPALKQAIDQCMFHISIHYYGTNPLQITGPTCWYRVAHPYEKYVGKLVKPRNRHFTDVVDITWHGTRMASKRYFCYDQEQRDLKEHQQVESEPYMNLWVQHQVYATE